MSGGFGLPAIDWSPLTQIGRTLAANAERDSKRRTLSDLGARAASGDYAGAAQAAFDAGDADAGLGLLKLGQVYKTQQLQQQSSDRLIQGLTDFGQGDGSPGRVSGIDALSPTATPRPPSFADTSSPAGRYLAGLTRRESGNNQYARNPNSSATGLGQFTDATWGDLMRRRPDLGLTADGRTDRDQAMRATAAFTEENEGILGRAGLPVNNATRYAVHFLGQSGGPAFIARSMQNPDAPAASLARPEQVSANRSVFYNRDGSPKSARQVFADFDRSFGGGPGVGSPASSAGGGLVAYADNEAQTQALERRMGMVPTQVASADQADMPAPDAREMAFYIPGSDPARSSSFVPTGSDAPRRSVPSSTSGAPSMPLPSPSTMPRAMPAGLGEGASSSDAPNGPGIDAGRTMTLPGDPASQGQGLGPQAQAQTIGNVPVGAVAAAPLSKRLPFLLRSAADPNLPDASRAVVMELLKRTLDETKLPEHVKEWQLARANGWTQARTPAEYQREQRGPTTLSPGSSVLSPDGQSIVLTAPDRDRSNVSADVGARRQAAADLGLNEGSAAYQSYVLTGKMPREDAQPLTAGDKKAIQDADGAVLAAQNVIDALGQAKQLSKQAYSGPAAGTRGYVSSLFGSEGGIATSDLDNLVTTQALGQLKAIFGAAPTEGERAILLQIQGSSSQPDAVRQRIYDRAIGLAKLRLQQNQDKADELRGQSYYRPGSGPQGGGQRGQGAPLALPPPSPSNRPGAGRTAAPALSAPAGAVEYLRQNPALSGAFDEKYGAGAAARALGGR